MNESLHRITAAAVTVLIMGMIAIGVLSHKMASPEASRVDIGTAGIICVAFGAAVAGITMKFTSLFAQRTTRQDLRNDTLVWLSVVLFIGMLGGGGTVFGKMVDPYFTGEPSVIIPEIHLTALAAGLMSFVLVPALAFLPVGGKLFSELPERQ